MSSISTAALEYNTNGELTIKNRQIESAGNSLKFKTINSVTGNDKLIDIKQNNNSRLSIDETGTGAIKIEKTTDSNNSSITIESNTSKTNSDKDLDSFIELKPKNIKLASKTYSQGNSESVENNFISLNYQYNGDSSILIKNNDYRLNDQNNNLVNNSTAEISLNKDLIEITKFNKNINKGAFIYIGDEAINFGLNNDVTMDLDKSNGFTVDTKSTKFTIRNNDFTIEGTKSGAVASLNIKQKIDNTDKSLISINKSVNINSLSIGSGGPTISSVAKAGSTPEQGKDDTTLPTIGYVKNLIPVIPAIPNSNDASNFYLQAHGNYFYLVYRNGPDGDKKVYGMKVALNGDNTSSTVTGFVGQLTDEGTITETTASG